MGEGQGIHLKQLFATIAGDDLAGAIDVQKVRAIVDVDRRSSGFGNGAKFGLTFRERVESDE